MIEDHSGFILTQEEFRQLLDALDRPEQDNPNLRRLLTKPSVFETQKPIPWIESLRKHIKTKHKMLLSLLSKKP